MHSSQTIHDTVDYSLTSRFAKRCYSISQCSTTALKSCDTLPKGQHKIQVLIECQLFLLLSLNVGAQLKLGMRAVLHFVKYALITTDKSVSSQTPLHEEKVCVLLC